MRNRRWKASRAPFSLSSPTTAARVTTERGSPISHQLWLRVGQKLPLSLPCCNHLGCLDKVDQRLAPAAKSHAAVSPQMYADGKQVGLTADACLPGPAQAGRLGRKAPKLASSSLTRGQGAAARGRRGGGRGGRRGRARTLEKLLAAQTKLIQLLLSAGGDPFTRSASVKGKAARHMLAEQFRLHPDKVYEAVRPRLATARRKGSSSKLVPGDAYEYFSEVVPFGTLRTLTYMGFHHAKMFEACKRGDVCYDGDAARRASRTSPRHPGRLQRNWATFETPNPSKAALTGHNFMGRRSSSGLEKQHSPKCKGRGEALQKPRAAKL